MTPAPVAVEPPHGGRDDRRRPPTRLRPRAVLRPPRTLPRYAELHSRSNFSFLTGASHPEELIERAAALGYGALAVTDECSLAGAVRAHVEAAERGFKLLVGSEIRVVDQATGAPFARLVLIAQSMRGYRNLAHWISVAAASLRRRAATSPTPATWKAARRPRPRWPASAAAGES